MFHRAVPRTGRWPPSPRFVATQASEARRRGASGFLSRREMRGHCATYNRHAVRLSISGEMQVSALPKNGFALQMPLAIQVPLMTREGPAELQQPDAYTRMALVSLIALFVAIVAVWLGYLQSHQTPGGERLFVYCAASVKPPLEA